MYAGTIELMKLKFILNEKIQILKIGQCGCGRVLSSLKFQQNWSYLLPCWNSLPSLVSLPHFNKVKLFSFLRLTCGQGIGREISGCDQFASRRDISKISNYVFVLFLKKNNKNK